MPPGRAAPPARSEGEHIAGCDLFAEAGVFDAAEKGELALILRQAERRHSASLGQCFEDEDTGHDGRTGEMAVEKFFVAGHALRPMAHWPGS